jgi:hypothetical protein
MSNSGRRRGGLRRAAYRACECVPYRELAVRVAAVFAGGAAYLTGGAG